MKTFKIIDGVSKYVFGNPINTEAVIIQGEEIKKDSLEFFTLEYKEKFSLVYKMDKDDIVFGLGENQRGINKRGGIYQSFCSDDPLHTENKKSLYGSHNFTVIYGKETFGVFIDFPGKVTFDVGFTDKNEYKITMENSNVKVFIIKGTSLKDIIKKFLKIIGRSYIPPKWAFGYQQSRWSYENESKINEISDKFIKNKIPCDAIYLDIDYMERYKDFTIDSNRFPDFKDFIKEMKNKGFRLVPIIDAGVKIEKGYDIYEEGIKNNYFCTNEDEEPFIAGVWPGRCHFPDFLNKNARIWFGLKYKVLTDLGIEGFWNDMNEPAIFYTNRGIKEAINFAKKSEKENLDISSYFELKDKFDNISNNILDYKSFYHNKDGNKINHYDVHNLFGYNMTRSASEGLRTIEPNKRFLLFSRSSYIGMHRYSGIWTGDNSSWWQHILLSIKMMPSLNMCGFLYIGVDTGGFSSDANAEILIRWTQFSLFTPLFRNHSAKGTRKQEPFAFDDETTNIIKNIINFRYSLIPYIYSEYMKAVLNNDIYFAPLIFEYNDEIARRVEDQLLVGDSLMISPIYEENAKGRCVYLPEDMLLWKVKNYKDRKYEVIKKGYKYLDVDIDEVPVFIRKNKMIVIGKPSKNVDCLENKELDIVAFVTDKAEYRYYDDDGKTYDFENGSYSEMVITITRNKKDYDIDIKYNGIKFVDKLNFEIVDSCGEKFIKTINL
ncbi:alpha-glucosidase [Clostridium novyi B str. ATCC 27606]|uniref:Alpha-glucosidase n=1 Tax=Clostridium novyi B str. ATCC 27606 TaxID=1443123 RepID=A0AA40IT96_CLONO|nr:TIM-barrel domain-containing protein [Clostridium novyi]KEI12221.1 alpha-glucosidase [Clostridium novyi B str. NCTC 9691]KEI15357.1 alpha-glucosidase [Clostridium novyi B str. ATCC 27606]